MARRIQGRISAAEALRAIYIDCEGFSGQSPTLIGILVDESLEQVVLDPDLEPVAVARKQRVASFTCEATRLLNKAKTEGRFIVAYSEHEWNLFSKYADIDIADYYCDARKLAKRWRNRMHPDRPLPNRGLQDFLRIINFPRRPYLGQKKSTKRIKAVKDMVLSKGSYEALTTTKKAQWTKLLEHNAVDCWGMRALVIHAALELGAI